MNPTVADLFCGAGGLSLGLREAGFKPRRAIDCWTPAVDTYRANLGDHVSSESIDDTTVFPDTDVIAGALPELSLAMMDGTIIVSVGPERLTIQRQPGGMSEDADEIPDDTGDVLPGV